MLGPIWCVPGVTALGVSIVFALSHPNTTVRFVSALLSVSALSLVQKLTVLSLDYCIAKEHPHLAVVFDTLFGNWVELSLTVVAVLKKDMATTQVLILSIVATNYFLLLGLGRMYDHKRQQTFTDAINPRYACVLLFSLVVTVLPTALDDGLSASTRLDHAVTNMAPSNATMPQKAATMARIIAVLSLVIFVVYVTLVCYMGSDMERMCRALCGQTIRGKDNSKNEPSGENLSNCRTCRGRGFPGSLTREPRHKSTFFFMESASYTARSNKGPWRYVLLFIASSVSLPFLCNALVNATVPGPELWSTLIFVKIMVITLFTGLTGLVAYVAHVLYFARTFDSAKAQADMVALITRLLLFFRPLCVVIQWAVHGTPPPAVALFPAALLLAAYFLETSIGEVVPGFGLTVLYIVFNAYFLTMT